MLQDLNKNEWDKRKYLRETIYEIVNYSTIIQYNALFTYIKKEKENANEQCKSFYYY